MNLTRKTLAVALLAAVAAPAAHAEIVIDNIANSEVSFEGLLQADATWFSDDKAFLAVGGQIDGTSDEYSMRRAEIVFKGKGPGNNEWVVGYDAFAKKWLDVNWKYKIGGDGNHYIQFGQYKQPISLEELSSTKNNDFIAKANITNTFGGVIARRVGVAYNYGDVNWGITGSIYTRELTRNLNQGNGFGVRGYFAPINDKGSILHLGLSHNRLEATQGQAGANLDDTARFRARPSADQALIRLIDTGNIGKAKTIAITGLEAFWVAGPVKVQSEYMIANVSRRDAALDSYSGKGGYVSGVWNITGETWGYKGGTPTTPLPNEPGTGMFQLGLRYDKMDLNDGGINRTGGNFVPYGVLGGKMSTWTVGANWYWRSNFKVSLNYVLVNSKKYTTKTSATFSQDAAWNNRTVNDFLKDQPNILEARLQFYW